MDALLNARREIRGLFARTDPEIRRARWVAGVSLALSNIIGAAVTFAIGVLAFPRSAVTSRGVEVLAVAIAAYLLFTLVFGAVLALRIETETESVLTSSEAVPPERLRHVLRSQWRHTRNLALFWLGGALLVGLLLATVVPTQALLVFRGVLTVLLGGLTTCALAFLVLEREMRPVVTRLRAALPEVTACQPSVRGRLLLAWLLGSGIPLIGIAISLAEQQGTDRTRLFVLLGVLTGAGILVGAYTSVLAAGSVADPLRSLHETMARVAEGDLGATVAVADSGEIGDLQLHFNRMTAGLREREQLREVFGRHVGADVARRAVDNARLGGETRQVSVLFVDVRGSTALAEAIPATRFVAMLNDLFTTVIGAVEAEGGWANKFAGDSSLCIFGAPLPARDHASSALRAARRLLAELGALRRRHPPLELGVAVASGTVVAGNVGSVQRYEYTVIGDPVNIAARLCELAKESDTGVLADGASVHSASATERAQWMARGDVQLRGRRHAVSTYAPRSPYEAPEPR